MELCGVKPPSCSLFKATFVSYLLVRWVWCRNGGLYIRQYNLLLCEVPALTRTDGNLASSKVEHFPVCHYRPPETCFDDFHLALKARFIYQAPNSPRTTVCYLTHCLLS